MKQVVSLIGCQRFCDGDATLVSLLNQHPVILPTKGNNIRTGLDALTDQIDIFHQIAAEVDDMAMIRRLASDSAKLAVILPIAVAG